MRAVLQRVSEARVVVDGSVIGEIGEGLLVLLAVQPDDTEEIADKMLHRISHYRMFSDNNDKMNLSLRDLVNIDERRAGLLLVSQFTLAADTSKGMRPGFSTAAPPLLANALFDHVVNRAREQLPVVATGRFGADMKVSLTNNGPVTFILDVPAR